LIGVDHLKQKTQSLPEVDYKPLTHPVPFHLHTSARSIVVGNDFSSMASASTTAPFTAPATNTSTTTTGASTFIAQPMPSFDQPFVPKRSARPPTECEPVQLHTDVRATERMQFEAMLQARERVDAELQARFLLEREVREPCVLRASAYCVCVVDDDDGDGDDDGGVVVVVVSVRVQS
jgi:hypothetical protein